MVALVLLAASSAGGSAPVYGAIAALLLATGLLLAGLARRTSR